MIVAEKSLNELLPLSLLSTPCVSIQKDNKVWTGAVMLIHYLESFTDSLIVTENTSPIGILGGKEIIENISKNPSSELFDNKTVSSIMDPNFSKICENTKLNELLKQWTQTRRAFSMIPNKLGGYSAVSARKLLEIGIKYNVDIKLSELPKKKVLTFQQDNSIKDIINLMLENNTRRLLLENSDQFISDRIIIEKIARDLNYLRSTNNFLELKINSMPFETAKVIDDDTNLKHVYDIMFGMLHPYLIFNDQVVSPWDLCVALLSEKITA